MNKISSSRDRNIAFVLCGWGERLAGHFIVDLGFIGNFIQPVFAIAFDLVTKYTGGISYWLGRS